MVSIHFKKIGGRAGLKYTNLRIKHLSSGARDRWIAKKKDQNWKDKLHNKQSQHYKRIRKQSIINNPIHWKQHNFEAQELLKSNHITFNERQFLKIVSVLVNLTPKQQNWLDSIIKQNNINMTS